MKYSGGSSRKNGGIYKFCIISSKRTSSLCHVSIVWCARYQCELLGSGWGVVLAVAAIAVGEWLTDTNWMGKRLHETALGVRLSRLHCRWWFLFSFHFSLAPRAGMGYGNVKMRIDLLFGSIKLDPWQFCFCTLYSSPYHYRPLFGVFLSLIAPLSTCARLQFYFPNMYILWVCVYCHFGL